MSSEDPQLSFILKLPIEVHGMIAEYLSDHDIVQYLRSCRILASAINDSVWYARFKKDFDFDFAKLAPEKKVAIVQKYKTRRCVCNIWVTFKSGWPEMQQGAIREVLALVLESNAKTIVTNDGQTIVSGLNLDFLKKYIGGKILDVQASPRKIRRLQNCGAIIGPQGQKAGTDILEHLFLGSYGPPSPLRTARSRSNRSNSRAKADEPIEFSVLPYLQLCLTHLILHPQVCLGGDNILATSQREVYKCYRQEPIFQGPNKQMINVTWLLHVVGFFKLHLKSPHEGIFSGKYYELDEEERPSGWIGKIEQGTKELGKHWLGAYTYLEHSDIAAVRNPDRVVLEYIIDGVNDSGDPFFEQELCMDFNSEAEVNFPGIFQDILQSAPAGLHFTGPNTPPRTPSTKYFTSQTEAWQWCGCIHSLPSQQGIPGWQRLTMMKYRLDDDDVPDFSQIWAYEGVVLPGGHIILGRWWYPIDDPLDDGQSYCGPFIFWQIHGVPETDGEQMQVD